MFTLTNKGTLLQVTYKDILERLKKNAPKKKIRLQDYSL